jgi:membrane-bound lytic murein transglycosylase MltF
MDFQFPKIFYDQNKTQIIKLENKMNFIGLSASFGRAGFRPRLLPVNSLILAMSLIFITLSLANAEPVSDQPQSPDEMEIALERIGKPFIGDLDQIKERRVLRVLVSYGKTNFFIHDGAMKGFEYELLKNYEAFLNQGVKKRTDHIHLAFIPVPFDRLLDDLNSGRGDIAAAGLTITPEREERVRFTNPYIPNIDEVAVTHAKAPEIKEIEGLSGRKVYVRSGSSYVEHLRLESDRMRRNGKTPIRVVETESHMATEDILELVNAGIVPLTVADHHIAEAWASVMPGINVLRGIKIHTGGRIAWAVRKNNPILLESLNQFINKNRKGSLLGNILYKRYFRNSKWIKNPVSAEELNKLVKLKSLFITYADRFQFDWLAIAAQAYQESGLDHDKKSRAGAVGIMQILPSTAADKNIHINDIHIMENNIHAGVKYLSFMRDRYFNDPGIDPAARVDFAWAAYNAGPNKINRLRRTAEKRGFNPDKWFNNVEYIAGDFIGRETVDYVANINKYYLAYKLAYENHQDREAQLEKLRR